MFRLEDDPGWKVERKSGASNGDVWGDYWVVTTADGTVYTFGQTTTGTLVVPVGNVVGYPCYNWSSVQCALNSATPTGGTVPPGFRPRGWK
jgi:hypothetical protein